MNKVVEFIKKYKIIVTILALLLVSFTIYIFVTAAEDAYANKIRVSETNITIQDGTPNADGEFDSDDELGNDSSDTNKKVRNFDQISYNVSYKLEYKEDSDLEDESTTRNVIIDVLLPTSINATVVTEISDFSVSEKPSVLQIGDESYNHYKFEYQNASMTEENNETIVVKDINNTNGTQIQPIIRVREKTDEDIKEVNEITDIGELSDDLVEDVVTVTAKDAYGIKLYSSNVVKNSNNTKYPVGILIYLPQDSNRGIKGIHIPEKISFNVNVQSSESDSTIITDQDASLNPLIENYDTSKYSILGFPEPSQENNFGSAGLSIVSANQNNSSVFKIDYTGINFNFNDLRDVALIPEAGNEGETVKYVSAKVFSFSTNQISKNVIYTISADNSNTITIEDNYEPFAGDYLSKIDFIDSSNITSNDAAATDPIFTKPGEAVYNYNEDFYIQDTITYGLTSGDTLENGFTNYIKVDNTAIRLVNVGNISDQTIDYYTQITSTNPLQNTGSETYVVSYGVGEWNSSNFEIKENAPGYCPKSLSNLSKEDLMNYYGGPCIKENENIKWYDSINSAAQEDKNNRNKIILLKFDFQSKYYPGTKTVIRLKAKTIKNINNIGKSYQIVSRGSTIWNGKEYYLSETPKQSVSDQEKDLKYIKSEYYTRDDAQKVGTIKENTNLPLNKYGNTIYVTPFKDFINTITVKDRYDSEKDSIYSGITDPMEIVINPVIYKSDMDASITGATVTVYLPTNLQLTIQNGDKTPQNKPQQTIDGVVYNVYDYTYTEEDIKYENESAAQTIPNLKIHAYISINTPDNTSVNVISTIDANLKPNIDSTTTYSSITSVNSRTNKKEIILRNTKSISSIGTSSKTYIDANSEYLYQMKAVNLTGSDASLELLYVLPYSGDGVGNGSNFDGTQAISLNTLPQGYNAYYTKDDSKKIVNNEISTSSSIEWTEWTNYYIEKSGITAIKIVPSSTIKNGQYFASENGIDILIKTQGNKESDVYYNNFYILHKGVEICSGESDDEDCETKESGVMPYASNISSVSVYNRKISGKVFEDYDYNGLYSTSEKRLNDIIVELYKLNNEKYTETDSKNPLSVVTGSDELIEDNITERGRYSFEGLKTGNYYVKYTFDCDKYTVTEKNKQDPTVEGDTSLIDSDADMLTSSEEAETCSAISNIVTLDNNKIQAENIDLGLRIRQNFDVDVKKYITNVVVNSNKGTQSYDYNNETKVKIDVKNLKNTSFRVTYGFEIENTKYFPGTIGNIVETIPEGMTFNPNLPENDGWYESDGNLYYSYLNKSLILPGEKYHMTIVLDLVTDNGGDYINFVAANNLRIMPTTTNFLESIEIDDDYDDSGNEGGNTGDNEGNQGGNEGNNNYTLTAPEITGGSDSWTNSSIKISVSKDSESSEGIKNYQYCLQTTNSSESCNWIDVKNKSQDISTKGINYVFFRAVDDKGNVSTPSNSQIVKIDKTAPDIPKITNPTNGNFTKDDFSLVLQSNDSESGLAYYSYSYDDKTYTKYDNSASNSYTTTPFKNERNENVYIKACDNVGNCSNANTTPIRIDKTLPTVSYDKVEGAYTSNQTVKITANDANFDHMDVHVYKHDGNNFVITDGNSITTNTRDITLGNGRWIIYTRVYDKASNKQKKEPSNGEWYMQEYIIAQPSISYTVGLMGTGNWSSASNNAMAGTTDKYQAIDQFNITNFNNGLGSSNMLSGSIRFQLHKQTAGDLIDDLEKFSYGNTGSATVGKRIEAIRIWLTGEIADYYDVVYQVHVQSQAWLGKAMDGEWTGSKSLCKRIEAIKIQIVPKGSITNLGDENKIFIEGENNSNCAANDNKGSSSTGDTSVPKCTTSLKNEVKNGFTAEHCVKDLKGKCVKGTTSGSNCTCSYYVKKTSCK